MFEEEYSEEMMEYDDAVAAFVRRMLLVSVFNRLSEEFTKEEFMNSFAKTFKSLKLGSDELEESFEVSIELEVIDKVNDESEFYKFNGISIYSEDWN